MSSDISSTRKKQEDKGKDKQQNEGVVSASSRSNGESPASITTNESPAMTSSTSTSISPTETSNLSVPSEQHQLEVANEAIREFLESDENSMKAEECIDNNSKPIKSTRKKKSKKKSKKRKLPDDAPRKPFTAYNFFFSDERVRILDSIPDPSTGEINISNIDTAPSDYKNPDDPDHATVSDKSGKTENISSVSSENGSTSDKGNESDKSDESIDLEKSASEDDVQFAPILQKYRNKKKARQNKTKSHGKIGFASLSKRVANRWRNLSKRERSYYQRLAAADSRRFKREMEEYEKNGNQAFTLKDTSDNVQNNSADNVQNNSEIAETFSVETFDSERFVENLKTQCTVDGVGFDWGMFGNACCPLPNAVPSKVRFLNKLLDSEMEIENDSEQNLPYNYVLADVKSTAMQRWLDPTEIMAILNHDNPLLDISTDPPASPPTSGQLFLFDRSVTKKYKNDGHQWVRKKNSNKVREDHVKFRLGGKFCVCGYYAHSSTISTFTRRSYYLLHPEKGTALYPISGTSPSLVLVHYLDTSQANQIKRGINRSIGTIPTLPSASVALRSGTAIEDSSLGATLDSSDQVTTSTSTTTTGTNGTPIPITPRPASTGTATTNPIRPRPASTLDPESEPNFYAMPSSANLTQSRSSANPIVVDIANKEVVEGDSTVGASEAVDVNIGSASGPLSNVNSESQSKDSLQNNSDSISSVTKKMTGGVKSKKPGLICQFPEQLYKMLTNESDYGIVSWMPHGRAFKVINRQRFTCEILPKYFKQTMFGSFQKQLSMYGFCRIHHGADSGAYYHELFLRGQPQLYIGIKRQKVKKTGVRLASTGTATTHPIGPRPVSTGAATTHPIGPRPVSTGAATLHGVGNRGSASVSSGVSNASGNGRYNMTYPTPPAFHGNINMLLQNSHPMTYGNANMLLQNSHPIMFGNANMQPLQMMADIWTIDELVKLKDAISIANRYSYSNYFERCEAIADIVGTRDYLEVQQCYEQAYKYGGIEPYIVHLYGRDHIANGVTREGISDKDVIYGRGIKLFHSNYNGMNRQLHHIREIAKEEIIVEKIARRVVHKILGDNGRFLVKDKKLGDSQDLYYPLEDLESAIALTIKRVEYVIKKDRQDQALQNHISDMESKFPAPQEGRPDLEDMIQDYENDPNDQRVVKIIKENMYVAVLTQFGMNQYTNFCTFCPMHPDLMEKVGDTEGEECIKPFLKMNKNTRNMHHVQHIRYRQLVIQNDERGTIDRLASGIRANDSHIFSWWHPSFLKCLQHGLENAVKRRTIKADITGEIGFMNFKFECDQTRQMIQAAQHFPELEEFRLSNDIITLDFVWRIRIGGETGILHPNTVVDCIRINGDECDIRIRGP